MNLADLQKEAHAISKAKGWWDTERSFGDLIAGVHSKLSEALEAYRANGLDSWLERQYPHSRDTRPLTHLDVPEEEDKPAGVASELADVVIRVADMAEHYSVDVDPKSKSHVHELPSLTWEQALSFGDWITEAHSLVSEAFHNRYEAVYVWAGRLTEVICFVHRMATHYDIDLHTAIAAKMEYIRTMRDAS